MIEPWKDPPELFNAQISRSKAVQALALPVPGVREVALPFLPLVFSLALLPLRAKHCSGGPYIIRDLYICTRIYIDINICFVSKRYTYVSSQSQSQSLSTWLASYLPSYLSIHLLSINRGSDYVSVAARVRTQVNVQLNIRIT